MKNQEVASLLYEAADLLELLEVDWKPRAYRKAAQSIESLSEAIEDIHKEEGKKGLEKISGVGKAIAMHIEEFLKKGKIKKFQQLKKKVPPGLKDLMEVSGLGAKRAMILYRKLKVKGIKDLEKVIKKHKIARLEGFGTKSEANISRGIEIFKKGQERQLLGVALPIGEEIVTKLRKLREVKRVDYAGSLRRMRETIGDIDILATSSMAGKVISFFSSLPDVKRVLAKGKTKCSVILEDGLQADLRVVADSEYGAAMQYFTGDKYHNIKLREIAIRKGYKLSEYGLFKGKRRVAGKTEEEIYKKLNLRVMPPELRHNTGELEAAREGKLPNLVEIKDIRGDLHMHTKYSDGSDSIQKMAEEAAGRGYEYVAITDHSKTRVIANGLDENRLRKQWKEIDAVNKKLKIRVLKGTECDILASGELDFSNKILRKFDIVVASIHSGFQATKRKMTDRIVKALENKHVTILGHPTGRIINKRPAYELDFEAVFEVAREKKKMLEINSQPRRLDLKDVYARAAVQAGCKLSIDTDSHSFEHLPLMKYGVATARRGWVEKKDVINTLSLKQILKFLGKD